MSCNHNHTKENPETFYFNGQAEDNCAACQAFGRQHEDQVLLAEFMYSDGHEGVIALKDGRFYSVHCSYITECTSYERLEFHHAAVIILDLVHKYTANVWPDRIAQWPALQTAIELYRYPVCAADLAKHATVIVTLSCPDSGNVISLSLSEWAALTHGGYYALPGQYTLDAECSGELFNRHRKIGLLRHPPHDWWTPVIHQAHDFIQAAAPTRQEIIVAVPGFTTDDRVNRNQNLLDCKATNQEVVPSIVNPDGLDESQLMSTTILAELNVMNEIALTVEITSDGTFISARNSWSEPFEVCVRRLTLQGAAIAILELEAIRDYTPLINHDRIAAIPELQEAITANEVK